MSETEKHNIRLQIEQIIERSRYQEEMFLIDSKTAASIFYNIYKRKI